MFDYMDIKDEVRIALENKKPVVALESTIISHGMPYPDNIAMAKRVEDIVRENGAVPATIAIIDGRIKVGLDDEEIRILAKSRNVIKTSRRDIPFIVAKKMNGATTVASTMIISHMAGIRVFATGGIGGVHRGAERTFDISADLQELANTNVAVICAGVKSILDIGLTLEYLETYGVPVIGLETDEFPAFYTRKSEFGVDYRCDDYIELADAIVKKWEMGLDGGLVIANPIPKEFEMDSRIIDSAIEYALLESRQNNIIGKDITPFLLSELVKKTGGKSLEANLQLVYNNAAAGARLSVAISNISLNAKVLG